MEKIEDLDPEYKEKSIFDRIASKSPMVLLGVAGLTVIVGHGLYHFRNRKMRPSLYLINYRLAAQGTFVGCVALAMVYKVFDEHIWKKIRKEQPHKELES